MSQANENNKMTPRQWIENFWYHYKIHTLVALFVLAVVIVTTVQMCSKTDYDAYILYAGDHGISNIAEDGDLPPYKKIISSLGRVCEDENGDGALEINLQALYVLTGEQLGGLDDEDTISLSRATEDAKTLDNMLTVGKYYLCFLSKEIFEQKDALYDGALFEPLEKYATDADIEYEYASERGIYLGSLPYADFIDLPEDTVVCLRSMNGYSSVIGSEDNQRNFDISERIIKNILSYK